MKILVIGLILVVLTACGQGSEPNSPVIVVPSVGSGGEPAQPPVNIAVRDAFIGQCNIENGVIGSGRLVVRPVNQNVLVVALGSSSTQGTGASTKNTTYPAVMQAFLDQNPKNINFSVVNKGISGDSIKDMEARLDRDVISMFPQVVILQTGVNDATSGMNLDDYYATLTHVISRLKINSSVVLMNSQTFSSEPSNYKSFLNIMDRVATEQNLSVIDRYGIFSSSIRKNIISLDDILSSDKFHNNDLGYQCIGKITAELLILSSN